MRFLVYLLVLTLMIAGAKLHAQLQPSPGPQHRASDPQGPQRQAAYEARMMESGRLENEARVFFKKGEIGKASPLLLQALQIDPDNYSARSMLADIYVILKRPADVVMMLQPIFSKNTNIKSSLANDEGILMTYVLALLDTGRWHEAVSFYEDGIKKPLRWAVPCYGVGMGGKDHTLREAHFDPNIVNVAGLRAQAHLILGTRWPFNGDIEAPKSTYLGMLDHLQQAIQNDPTCTDAHFLRGVILSELNRFDEARDAFRKTLELVPRETRPEVEAAIAGVHNRDAQKKLFEAAEAGRTAAKEADSKETPAKE